MAITIIDRMEQKYFVSFDDYVKLMEKIDDKLVKDKLTAVNYTKLSIFFIYFIF